MTKRYWTIPARRVTDCEECPHFCEVRSGCVKANRGVYEEDPPIPSWCPMIGRKK